MAIPASAARMSDPLKSAIAIIEIDIYAGGRDDTSATSTDEFARRGPGRRIGDPPVKGAAER